MRRTELCCAGAASATEIRTREQCDECLRTFKNPGFKIKSKTDAKPVLNIGKKPEGRNAEYISSEREYCIRGLRDLASRQKNGKSLRAMIKRIAKVDDLRF